MIKLVFIKIVLIFDICVLVKVLIVYNKIYYIIARYFQHGFILVNEL